MLVDHAEVRRILGIEHTDHPDAGALPPLNVASSLLDAICPRLLEQRPLGRRLPGSGLLHAAALLQLLGHG